MDSLIVYNPSSNMISELIPLFTKTRAEEVNHVLDGYSIVLSAVASKPVAYVLFTDEVTNGTLINSETVEAKLKDGTIVEL